MSHFTRIKLGTITDVECLERAVADTGQTLEAGEGLTIRGFGGATQHVDLLIRRKRGYDIGFAWQDDSYQLVADWYGVEGLEKEQFMNRLNQRYAYHVTTSRLAEQGFEIVEEVESAAGLQVVFRRVA